MSLSGVSSCVPMACSGDMYSGVPTIAFSCVSVAESMSFETPKSSTLTKSSRPPPPRQKDVGRLQVAMHDAGGVRDVERLGDLGDDAHGRDDADAPALQPIGEVLALEHLHHQVGRAGLGDLVVEDLDDVRMGQRRGDLRLAPEARQRRDRRLRVDGLAEDLHGKAARQAHVLRLVHHAHTALGDDALESVGAVQQGADGRR